ncbi:MAG: polysaccharide deacetylase family protein [Clostridiales bacterium]|jgi:peptidoglycan-N-acetylmuramic acid deacetylase|nr:polysaccharide deacetylase family protein [Clostridiales bacterium]
MNFYNFNKLKAIIGIAIPFFILSIIAFNTQTVSVNSPDESSSRKLIEWGFKKVPDSAPEVPESTIELLKNNSGFYLGDTTQKKLYLTFDAGFEAGYTESILNTLKEHNVPATFFVTGHYIKTAPELIKRMVSEGHHVGNHTINHINMPKSTDEKIAQELNDLKAQFNEVVGSDIAMDYLRPPKGEFSEHSLQVSKNLGYKSVFWSSAYVDWDENKLPSKESALKQVTGQFHNGSIILLHNTSKRNMEILADVIKSAQEQGYTFADLDEIQ